MAKSVVAEQNNMTEGRIWEIELNQIRSAPWNLPARSDPKTIQELAESIAVHGQQIPALVRPLDMAVRIPGEDHKYSQTIHYELVFGHRRCAALRLLEARSPISETRTVKAFIRELSEEEAMVLSGIENLQRQGFSDIEEAEFFRDCGARYGEPSVKMLGEKLSVSEKYIRKILEILGLPECALELWKNGTWHVGHMEQLLRVGEPGDVSPFIERLKEQYQYGGGLKQLHVYQLKEHIDRMAIILLHGRFDTRDCKVCRKNTQCQLTLFGGEKEKGAKCLDAACFKVKQQAWLDVNWKSCKDNKFGTQVGIIGDHNTPTTGEFRDYQNIFPAEKCGTCEHYTTLLNLIGTIYTDRVCMGDKCCFASRKMGGNGKPGEANPDAVRVSWHGEYFRQQFYRREIPGLVERLLTEDPRRLQLVLATIIYSTSSLFEWFCGKIGINPPQKESYESYLRLSFCQILEASKIFKPIQVEYLMAEAVTEIALRSGRGYEITFTDSDRQAIAEFLDIDFKKFQVNEEWFQKKTRAELVKFIVHESGLPADQSFQEYLGRYGLTLEKMAGCKKAVLVQIITDCGVDLRGRLPKEIADLPKLGGSHV